MMPNLKSALFALSVAAAAFLAPALSHAEESVTLEQCHDQLLSGDFSVSDARKDFRPLNQIPKELAKSVQELIDHKDAKDFGRSENRFDRLHGNLMRKIEEGRWAINETSQEILDDCYFAIHPEDDGAE